MEYVGLQVTGPIFASNGGDYLCRLTYKLSVQGRCEKSAQKIWRNCAYDVDSVEISAQNLGFCYYD